MSRGCSAPTVATVVVALSFLAGRAAGRGPELPAPEARAGSVACFGLQDPALYQVDTGRAVSNDTLAMPALACHDTVCYLVGGAHEVVRGARVSQHGLPLDAGAVVFSASSDASGWADVAAGPSCFLAVWQDDRAGVYDVYAARVTFDGLVLDPGGLPLCVSTGDQTHPCVVASDSCWLVVWSDCRHDADVFGTRVSFTGEVLDPGGLPIGPGAGNQAEPDVASSGSQFLVVWETSEAGSWVTRGARVSSGGEVLDPGGIYIAGEASRGCLARSPAVASDGSDFMVAWLDWTQPGSVFATRVSAAGLVAGDHIRMPASSTNQLDLDIAYSHRQYLVTWAAGGERDVGGARVSADGILLDSAALRLGFGVRDQYGPAAVGTPAGWLAAWTDYRFGNQYPAVYGATVDTLGAVCAAGRSAAPPLQRYAPQVAPACAAGRDGALLVWEAAGTAPIHGVRLDSTGMPIGPGGFGVTAAFGVQYTPAVARGASGYLVVWSDKRCYPSQTRIYGARVTFDGRLLDGDGFVIPNELSRSCYEPDIAFDGCNFLVVWHDEGSGRVEIRGARVTQDGIVLDPSGFLICSDGGTHKNPEVAFDGDNFLVVWERTDAPSACAVRVRPDGTVIEPYPFPITYYSARQPDVAFDGENYLVVWTDGYSDYGFGTRVTPAGQVLDTARVRLTWGEWVTACREPCVAFDGDNYVLTWADDWSRAGIKGMLVSPELVKLDSFELAPPTDWGLASPCLAFGEGFPGILACSGRTPPGMPWDTVARVHVALAGLPPGQPSSVPEPTGRIPGVTVRPALFRGATRISTPPALAGADIRVFDASGRCVRHLPADAAVTWDGRDDRGRILPAGVYIIELVGPSCAAHRKLAKLE